MWKYFHKWFGWDYVLLTYYSESYVERLRISPSGLKYVERAGQVIELKEDGTFFSTFDNKFTYKWRKLT